MVSKQCRFEIIIKIKLFYRKLFVRARFVVQFMMNGLRLKKVQNHEFVESWSKN